MSKIFSTEELIHNLKNNTFILHSNMPMGYVPGLPILCILNGNLCMKVPFLKYKVTGEVDQTFVYPIKYVATITLTESIIVGFEDLSFRTEYAKVDFSNPIGKFRHEAIKHLDKRSYKNLRSELYAEYDKIINSLTNGDLYETKDEIRFKSLFNTLLEPSLQSFYKALDIDFTNKYLSE